MDFLNRILSSEEPPAMGLKDETKRDLARLCRMANFTLAVKTVVPKEFTGFKYDGRSSDEGSGTHVFSRPEGDYLHQFLLFRTSKLGGGFSVELGVSLLPYFPFHDYGSLGARFGRRIRLGRLFAGCDYWWHWGRETGRMPGLITDGLVKIQSYSPRFFKRAGERLLSDEQSLTLAKSSRRWVADWRTIESRSEEALPPVCSQELEARIEQHLSNYPIYSDLHAVQRRFCRFILSRVLQPHGAPSTDKLDAAFHFAGLLMLVEGV